MKIFKNNSVNLLIVISFLSKCAGVLRDLSLTYFWGANKISDSFIIALTIPGTLCDLLIQAVAVGYIPTYMIIQQSKGKEDANRFTIEFIELLILCCLPIIFIVIIFPDIIIKIFASGFDSTTNKISSFFIQITTISILFKLIVSVLSGFLQSNKKYIVPAFLGIPYDIVIILGIALSYKLNLISLLPISIVFAGVIQALILAVSAKKINFHFRISKNIINSHTKSIISLLIPLLIIVGTNQLNVIIDKTFASYVQTGAITILDYSNKVCLMIENIVVFSIIAILYPKLSEASANNDCDTFSKELADASEKCFRYLVPITIFIIIAAKPIISILLGWGSFTDQNVIDTSNCMMFYAIGSLFVALKTIYIRALYAIRKVNIVTIISVLTLLLNLFLNMVLVKILKLNGLALATSISAIFSALVMMFFLKKNYSFIRTTFFKSCSPTFISSIIVIITTLTTKYVLSFIKFDFCRNFLFLSISGLLCGITILFFDKQVEKYNKQRDWINEH